MKRASLAAAVSLVLVVGCQRKADPASQRGDVGLAPSLGATARTLPPSPSSAGAAALPLGHMSVHVAAIGHRDLGLHTVEGALLFSVPNQLAVVHEGRMQLFGPIGGTLIPPLCWGRAGEVLGRWPDDVRIEIRHPLPSSSGEDRSRSEWVRLQGGRWASSGQASLLRGGELLRLLPWSGSAVARSMPSATSPLEAELREALVGELTPLCPEGSPPSLLEVASSSKHVAAWVACGNSPPRLALLRRDAPGRAFVELSGISARKLREMELGGFGTRVVSVSPEVAWIALDTATDMARIGAPMGGQALLCHVEGSECKLAPAPPLRGAHAPGGPYLLGLASTSDGTLYSIVSSTPSTSALMSPHTSEVHRRAPGASEWERIELTVKGSIDELAGATLLPTDIQAEGRELWVRALARPDTAGARPRPWPTLLLRSVGGESAVVRFSVDCP